MLSVVSIKLTFSEERYPKEAFKNATVKFGKLKSLPRELDCTGKSAGGAGILRSGNGLKHIRHRHRVGVTS